MTETDLIATVILVKLMALALALVLAHLTFSAWRRSGRTEMEALAIGFGGIALGIILGGGLYQFLGYDILVGLLVEGVFTTFGLGMIVYSLYGYN